MAAIPVLLELIINCQRNRLKRLSNTKAVKDTASPGKALGSIKRTVPCVLWALRVGLQIHLEEFCESIDPLGEVTAKQDGVRAGVDVADVFHVAHFNQHARGTAAGGRACGR